MYQCVVILYLKIVSAIPTIALHFEMYLFFSLEVRIVLMDSQQPGNNILCKLINPNRGRTKKYRYFLNGLKFAREFRN